MLPPRPPSPRPPGPGGGRVSVAGPPQLPLQIPWIARRDSEIRLNNWRQSSCKLHQFEPPSVDLKMPRPSAGTPVLEKACVLPERGVDVLGRRIERASFRLYIRLYIRPSRSWTRRRSSEKYRLRIGPKMPKRSTYRRFGFFGSTSMLRSSAIAQTEVSHVLPPSVDIDAAPTDRSSDDARRCQHK